MRCPTACTGAMPKVARCRSARHTQRTLPARPRIHGCLWDELGLFVIVNTPGWQFWNEAPSFAQDVYSDIRNIVRRDRNHPSVWLWEPILNETWYPADFAKKVKDIVHEEYPLPYCYAACDASARGSENYNVLFSHPQTGDPSYGVKSLN